MQSCDHLEFASPNYEQTDGWINLRRCYKKYNNKTYQVSYLEYRYLNLTETVTRLKKAIAPGKGTVVQINFTDRHWWRIAYVLKWIFYACVLQGKGFCRNSKTNRSVQSLMTAVKPSQINHTRPIKTNANHEMTKSELELAWTGAKGGKTCIPRCQTRENM